MRITYGAHALDILAEREIARAWVERTVSAPESREPDPKHSERIRAYRSLPERDGRMLRVVYVPTVEGAHIVTAFLDRGRSRGGRT